MNRKLLAGASLFLAGILSGYVAAQLGAPSTFGSNHQTSEQVTISHSASLRRFESNSLSRPLIAGADLEARIRELPHLISTRRWYQVRDLARDIAPGQESAALELARATLNRRQFMTFQSSLIEVWAERDPSAVLAYGLGLKRQDHRADILFAGVREFARTDADAAFAWLNENVTGSEHDNLMNVALLMLAGTNPELALEKVEGLPLVRRQWMRNPIIEALALSDPKRAAELAIGINTTRYFGSPEAASGSLEHVMATWMQQDPDAAVAWFAAQPEAVRTKSSVMHGLRNLVSNDPASAMKLLEHVPPGPLRKTLMSTVLSSLGRVAPDQLKLWMDTRTDPREKRAALLSYAQGLAQDDPKGAAEMLRGVKGDAGEASAFNQVFQQYARRDPKAALALAMEMGDTTTRKGAVSGALAGWALTEPLAAADYALALPSGAVKNEAVSKVAQQLGEIDPATAMEFLKKVPNPAVQREAVESLLSSVIDRSPQLAVDMIEVLPDGMNKNEVTAQLVSRLAETDISGAVDLIKTLPEGMARTRALQHMGWRWASQDPATAADFLSELPSGQAREEMVSNLSRSSGWAEPETALKAAEKIPESSRQKYLEGVVSSWAGRDPEAASKYIAEVPEGSARDKIVKQVASQWSNSDASAALEWVQALPQGEGRAGALAGVLGNWAAQSPQEAATYVTSLQGEELERGMKSVISSMAGSDPGYAASWVQQFPEGAVREQAEEALMKRWAREDPTAAATWLTELPQGGNRDVAIKNFAETAAAHEPQLAWQWAMTIRDPEQKREVLERAAASWVRQNDGEARAAIQASGLPADVQTKLLRRRD